MSWEPKDEKQVQPPVKPEMSAFKKNLIAGLICFAAGGFCVGAVTSKIIIDKSTSNTRLYQQIREEKQKTKEAEKNVKTVYVTVPFYVTESIETTKETAPVTEIPETESIENTYDHNEYYDVVETTFFKNSINYTVMVHKVLAKKDVSVSGTVLAYGADGNVVGKSSDDIVLTAGQYNYFRYSFENDLSDATIKTTYQAKKDSFLTGERNANAVEMEQYNHSGNQLYITFKQNVDKIDSFAKFKILFYNGDEIVDTEDGYFNVYAKNLNGNGATDVAEIWAYDINYDRIEYIYEP